MISTLKGRNVNVYLWADVKEVESGALDQLRNIAALPWTWHHVAVMPDVHFGKGATVGSVIAMKDAISPAAVGVDIGCGMGAVKTNLVASDLPESLRALRLAVEEAIPVGFNSHGSPISPPKHGPRYAAWVGLWERFKDLDKRVQGLHGRAMQQVGTLGGGNHFLELCLDSAGSVWLMLHSGSRNIGKELAEIHIAVAKTLAHNKDLPDRDLAVFLAGTKEMERYWFDLKWAQDYAFANREAMLELYAGVLSRFFPHVTFDQPILCHHNYVSKEAHYGENVLVTRKGAINAEVGRLGIIPGSMGTRSFIVRGLGNPESFCSASHGAGRRMSRGAAKRAYTTEDLVQQTAGVECRKEAGLVDEIPAAYKDIEAVMANQADLVEVVAELRQVMCVKGF